VDGDARPDERLGKPPKWSTKYLVMRVSSGRWQRTDSGLKMDGRRRGGLAANGAKLLVVGFEWRPTIRGGDPSSGGVRGFHLGAARPTVVSSEAHGAERNRAATREVGVASEVVEYFSCSSNGGIRPWCMGYTWRPARTATRWRRSRIQLGAARA
jgi:hypothetical protein